MKCLLAFPPSLPPSLPHSYRPQVKYKITSRRVSVTSGVGGKDLTEVGREGGREGGKREEERRMF